MANIPNTNSGHGHVWSRPDGAKARCGGTIMCPVCKEDERVYKEHNAAQGSIYVDPTVKKPEPTKHEDPVPNLCNCDGTWHIAAVKDQLGEYYSHDVTDEMTKILNKAREDELDQYYSHQNDEPGSSSQRRYYFQRKEQLRKGQNATP